MSTEKTFEEMTNKELAELISDFGIEVDAANPFKPNKTEYVTALNAFKEKQDKVHGIEAKPTKDIEETTNEVEVPHVVVEGEKVFINESSSIELIRADLLRKERIIVTDLRESQTREPTVYVNWGNRMLGNKADVIALDGKPQYVRRGAILNLEATELTTHEPDDSGKDKMIKGPRYVITRVKGMSQKELTQLGVKQRMRDSKH